jgi:hypothetical protein
MEQGTPFAKTHYSLNGHPLPQIDKNVDPKTILP